MSTAIFAIINAGIRLGDRAALQDPTSYVGLSRRAQDTDFSYLDYRYYRDHATAFEAVNAESGRFGFMMGPFSSGKIATEAEEVDGRFESASFLSVIGLQPALGRSFSKEEEQMGGPPITILNFRFWKRRFAADPDILGKTVVLNGHALSVIGIANAQFAAADAADFTFH